MVDSKKTDTAKATAKAVPKSTETAPRTTSAAPAQTTKADGTPTADTRTSTARTAEPRTATTTESRPAAREQDKAQTDPAQSVAYDQGRAARAHGISKDDAPYTAGTSELTAWQKGYKFEQDNERG